MMRKEEEEKIRDYESLPKLKEQSRESEKAIKEKQFQLLTAQIVQLSSSGQRLTREEVLEELVENQELLKTLSFNHSFIHSRIFTPLRSVLSNFFFVVSRLKF